MYLVRKVKDASPREITCGIMRLLTSDKDFSGVNFIHVMITNETKKHYHNHATECYYVLEGSVRMELDGELISLTKDEFVMIFPKTKHKAWKTSKSDAKVLVITCPPWQENDEILLE